MVTMQSYNQSNSPSFMADINRDDSILIIGSGENEQYLNEFIKPAGLYDMKNKFGTSSLTDAYEVAITLGARNVYVMNCYKTTDYIDSIPFVSQYNFAFVVPVGIKLSDRFYSNSRGREMYFAEYYLNAFSKFTNSLIIFTDEHASLYEDIDHYLIDMHTKVDSFKAQSNYVLDNSGRNLAFCLNNVQNNLYGNVILAALLSRADIGHYPTNIERKAIFDLHSSDIYSNEIIYFKNNYHIGITVENLKNFRTINDANKLITIDRVIKHIERTLNTSFAIGKLYNQYIKMNLHDHLDMYFRGLLNTVIRNYRINNLDFVIRDDMTGYFVADIDIYPINSLEKINALLEVR